MRSPLRSPAQVEGPQGVLPQPEKDLERPSSARLEATQEEDPDLLMPSPVCFPLQSEASGNSLHIFWFLVFFGWLLGISID